MYRYIKKKLWCLLNFACRGVQQWMTTFELAKTKAISIEAVPAAVNLPEAFKVTERRVGDEGPVGAADDCSGRCFARGCQALPPQGTTFLLCLAYSILPTNESSYITSSKSAIL